MNDQNSEEQKILDEMPDRLRQLLTPLLDEFGEGSKHRRSILIEAIQLITGDYDNADIKLMAKTIGELRHGLDVFRPYQTVRKVSVFGSARTRTDDPRYIQTKNCAEALSREGFMIITGGGPGIMQAANEGATEKNSFAININLPLEQQPNPFMVDSPRHFKCQYFFTRKLFFLKESDAVILAPGGFGTLDEAFETLTLIQTGRNPPIPVIMLEAPDDDYWGPFMNSWMRRFIKDGVIDADDSQLLFHTDSIEAAVDHINDFYLNYHSFRYVGKVTLLRLLNPISEDALDRLNAEFSDVLCEGEIEQVFNWPKSDDDCYDHLPRLRLHLDRRQMSALPQIIRRMNGLYQYENRHTQK